MKIILEYVWLDGRRNLRSKYKTIDWIFNQELSLQNIPDWNYDGSSTYQATTENSEVTLVPVAFYKNPLFEG
jgi:glutamine synthetase